MLYPLSYPFEGCGDRTRGLRPLPSLEPVHGMRSTDHGVRRAHRRPGSFGAIGPPSGGPPAHSRDRAALRRTTSSADGTVSPISYRGHERVPRDPLGCPGGSRTHTDPGLSRMPLPLGYGAMTARLGYSVVKERALFNHVTILWQSAHLKIVKGDC